MSSTCAFGTDGCSAANDANSDKLVAALNILREAGGLEPWPEQGNEPKFQAWSRVGFPPGEAGLQRMKDCLLLPSSAKRALSCWPCQVSRSTARPPSWHRLGPRDMSLKAKRSRHVAVAIPQVRVSRGI